VDTQSDAKPDYPLAPSPDSLADSAPDANLDHPVDRASIDNRPDWFGYPVVEYAGPMKWDTNIERPGDFPGPRYDAPVDTSDALDTAQRDGHDAPGGDVEGSG
jgi:hypothetical protein